MTDIRTLAWNALTPEQRPEGMEFISEWASGPYFIALDWYSEWDRVSAAAAYDRLCVACERVLLEAGWVLAWNFKMYCWGKTDIDRPDCSHGDRLTAAVLALEAMREKP